MGDKALTMPIALSGDCDQKAGVYSRYCIINDPYK